MPTPAPYDERMECLARLRSEPHGTAIADLATDLKISEDETRSLLAEIEAMGFKIKRWHASDRWVVAIAVDDYQRAARKSAAYVDLREDAVSA